MIASINASEEEGLVIASNKLALTATVDKLRTDFTVETGKISSRVGQMVGQMPVNKPNDSLLFRFDGQITSTNGLVVAQFV